MQALGAKQDMSFFTMCMSFRNYNYKTHFSTYTS